MPEKRKIRPGDFFSYKLLNHIDYSCNLLLFDVTAIHSKKNACFSNLWLSSPMGEKKRSFTAGEAMDSQGRFSPNGEWIAYVSTRSGQQQIHLMPVHGGESIPLSDMENGYFSSLSWSPDGSMICFAFQRADTEESKKLPRYIKKFHFKQDGAKLSAEDHWHIWTLEVDTGYARQVTEGEFDHGFPTWSPDSGSIAFITNRSPEAFLDISNTDLWKVELETGALTRLTTEYGPVENPVWSPNGKYIAYLGHRGSPGEDQIRNHHVWVYDLGEKECRDLTPRLDLSCLNLMVSDTVPPGLEKSVLLWEKDSSALYTLVSDRGRCHVYRVPIEDQRPYPITSGDICVHSYVAAGNRLYYIASSPSSPSEVYSVNVPSTYAPPDRPYQVTHFNQRFMESLSLSRPRFFQCKGLEREVYGLVYSPPDFDPTRKYPLILMIHGGPYTFYGSNFYHEMHCLAAEGFVVLCPNQGGSQGYGEHHASLIHHHWGKNDYPELMKAVDHIVSQGYIEETRMGVAGGSYGGFMTSWIISHTQRFAAAISMRGIIEFFSIFGSSDAGTYLSWMIGGPPWRKPDAYQEWSPLFRVERIQTPLLIIHSEGDQRAPIAQAEQLYVALRCEKKKVEMLYFPGESHSLTRGGVPSNRLAHLEAVRDWFVRYLKS